MSKTGEPMRQAFNSRPTGADSAAQSGLRVRNLVFTCVYYNNGNSLPVFSIPTIWGKVGQAVRQAEGCCLLSHLFTTVNRALDSVFFGDVRAPHLLKAGVSLARRSGRRPIQGTFSIHVQNDLASRAPVEGPAKGKCSCHYVPNEG